MGKMRMALVALLGVGACGKGRGDAGQGTGGPYDLVLKGGWIIDGSGNPRYQGDVAITGDRVVGVGFLSGAAARETVDVRGLAVAPGFIDMMGQSEINVLIDNRVLSKVTQGVTTEVTGEGGSVAPLTDQLVLDDSDAMKKWHYREDWRDLDGYFAQLAKQGSTVNIATFVGATQARLAVVGKENRAPTGPELAHMTALVDTLMEQGALGLWTALEYAPASYSTTDEIIALAKAARRHGGIYASHMRNEGIRIDDALNELFQIARQADIPAEVSHLKVSGRKSWGQMARIVAVYSVMSEPDVQTAMKTWWLAVNTDFGGVAPDGPFGSQSAHPRAYGTFARILGHYARDLKLFPLEFAVRKMTSLAAQRVGLVDRGLLKPGLAADVTVFDLRTVADQATFEQPHRPSVGFAYVFVNGQKVLDHGKLAAARPGRGLRGPGYVPPERRGKR